MENLNLDKNEQYKHVETIDRLCEKFPEHTNLIRDCYLEILTRVSPEASIRTYLTILITREIEAIIRIRKISSGH